MCSLRSNCSSKCHQLAVAPIVPWLRRCPSKHPQPDAFVIDVQPVRKAANHSVPVGSQSRRTIEQVLRRVVGGISDEGFWVDDEPGLAFRPEDVACVQIGSQHNLCGSGAWQLRKKGANLRGLVPCRATARCASVFRHSNALSKQTKGGRDVVLMGRATDDAADLKSPRPARTPAVRVVPFPARNVLRALRPDHRRP